MRANGRLSAAMLGLTMSCAPTPDPCSEIPPVPPGECAWTEDGWMVYVPKHDEACVTDIHTGELFVWVEPAAIRMAEDGECE